MSSTGLASFHFRSQYIVLGASWAISILYYSSWGHLWIRSNTFLLVVVLFVLVFHMCLPSESTWATMDPHTISYVLKSRIFVQSLWSIWLNGLVSILPHFNLLTLRSLTFLNTSMGFCFLHLKVTQWTAIGISICSITVRLHSTFEGMIRENHTIRSAFSFSCARESNYVGRFVVNTRSHLFQFIIMVLFIYVKPSFMKDSIKLR